MLFLLARFATPAADVACTAVVLCQLFNRMFNHPQQEWTQPTQGNPNFMTPFWYGHYPAFCVRAELRHCLHAGENCLALPKLNLQFLTFHDYLLRNFNLFRLEATYEIREDISDVTGRVGAFR